MFCEASRFFGFAWDEAGLGMIEEDIRIITTVPMLIEYIQLVIGFLFWIYVVRM